MKFPSGLKIERIEESPVLTQNGVEVGRESYVFLEGERQPIGGGFGVTAEEARTIALAETIERVLVWGILDSGDQSEITRFGLDKNPSSSGFAYGFDAQATALRALREAFEHYVRYHALYLGKRADGLTILRNSPSRRPVNEAIFAELSQHISYIKQVT